MASDRPEPISQVDVDALAPLLDAGAVLVDVRMPDEFEAVRVPGAQLIPLPEFMDRCGEIPEADEVYLICRSGGRSLKACELLAAAGRRGVNVAGGTMAWVESGRTTESGPESS